MERRLDTVEEVTEPVSLGTIGTGAASLPQLDLDNDHFIPNGLTEETHIMKVSTSSSTKEEVYSINEIEIRSTRPLDETDLLNHGNATGESSSYLSFDFDENPDDFESQFHNINLTLPISKGQETGETGTTNEDSFFFRNKA